MSKPQLPHRAEDSWPTGAALDRPPSLRDVSGAGGLVLAGGAAMLMLRPGAKIWKQRPLLENMGPVLATAAEPKPPWRFAVASHGGITMFGLPKDQILTLTAVSPDVEVTHMAWGAFGKERVLYLRWTGGLVGRVRLDEGRIEHLSTMPMDAIASDPNGVLAMVAVHGEAGDAHALMTRDGIRFEERPVAVTPASDAPEARVHLAVADAAIAYSVDGCGTHVSRGVDDDFVACEGLPHGSPLAFQGSTADAALFGVNWTTIACAIDRVDNKGAARRIVEIGCDDARAPTITALQWDSTRHTLWVASPEAGLMKSEEPKGKARGERTLN